MCLVSCHCGALSTLGVSLCGVNSLSLSVYLFPFVSLAVFICLVQCYHLRSSGESQEASGWRC